MTAGYENDVKRIAAALDAAGECVSAFTPGRIASERKAGGDPVTEADLALDKVLKEMLLGPDEGWLSEETKDNPERLGKRRVWIVDPIDGTREFIDGIPEWCISVGLAVEGYPVAGGIYIPAANQLVLGAQGLGITLNGKQTSTTHIDILESARILASRSEIRKGLWKQFETSQFITIPCGSIAYKLSQVATGLADATFTLVPKNEWDIAAGTALILAAGGIVKDTRRNQIVFNRSNTLLPGLIACGTALFSSLDVLISQAKH